MQMLSLDEEVQISSVQIQAVGADDDFTANPLQVQRGGQSVPDVAIQEEESGVFLLD